MQSMYYSTVQADWVVVYLVQLDSNSGLYTLVYINYLRLRVTFYGSIHIKDCPEYVNALLFAYTHKES